MFLCFCYYRLLDFKIVKSLVGVVKIIFGVWEVITLLVVSAPNSFSLFP